MAVVQAKMHGRTGNTMTAPSGRGRTMKWLITLHPGPILPLQNICFIFNVFLFYLSVYKNKNNTLDLWTSLLAMLNLQRVL